MVASLYMWFVDLCSSYKEENAKIETMEQLG